MLFLKSLHDGVSWTLYKAENLLMYPFDFLTLLRLVNVCCSCECAWMENRHEEKNSWKQAHFCKHWKTFTEHCRQLAWKILVTVQLTYKTGLAQVRSKADQDQPGQDSSGRFSEEAVTGGSPVWKWKLISDREDNKACKKCERMHSESMTRRERQGSVISIVFAPGSVQCCWADVSSGSAATLIWC